MKIDIHAHMLDRRYIEAMWSDFGLEKSTTPQGQTLMRRNGYTYMWYRESFFDVDHRLRVMDQQGVDMRILSLSSPSVYDWQGARQVEIARLMNDATAALVRRHPDRFAGIGSLPLGDVEASLAELDRIVGELELKGVMIGSNVGGVQVNDPRFEPVWAKVDALRLPVFEHPMFPPNVKQEEFELPLRLGFIFDTTTAAARLIYSGVFERYPNFPYIMAHTGGALLMVLERLDNGYRLFPDCRQHIKKLPSEYAKRLYYDTASFYGPALMMAHAVVGPEHILWGTDEPMIAADSVLVEGLPIPEPDKAKILGGNAARIFGLTQRAAQPA
jgi:aminocarboxymuconate-semialdehyde decarboxylase